MILELALAIAIGSALILLAGSFSLAARIEQHTHKMADDVMIVRAGSIKIRADLTALLAAVDRLENHVRGPAGAYGPPPAKSSAYSDKELEPAP